jgi:hypothetical protein
LEVSNNAIVRWEYKVASVPTTPRELQAHLDQDGCEEWELISTTPLASRLLLLFKRPQMLLQEEPEAEPSQEETIYVTEEQAEAMAESGEQVEYVSENAQQ